MITETGKVVAIETNGVWVETANQSACGRCAARKGCGQSLLVKADGHRSYIQAAWNGHASDKCREGDLITIGIHESAVLRGSLMVYCLPLLGLVVGAIIGNILSLPEAGVAASTAIGLTAATLGVRWFSRRHVGDPRFQPVVVALSNADSDVVQVAPQSLTLADS